LRIRPAESSDRQEVISFCVNTFSWGDYIDRVWDYWFRAGKLLVVEESGRKIAMSHVAVCPDEKSAWLEGVRVHPDYRRSKVATRLLAKMIEYGRKKGARQVSAIVYMTNLASQRMLEKNGFQIKSRWAYYSAAGKAPRKKSSARLATIDDLAGIWQYLQSSEVYSLSAKRYVKSWHWYTLDRKALRKFVMEKGVVVAGEPIGGVALVNRRGYWDKKSVLQIVYLDALSKSPLLQLVSFASNLYLDGEFEELQILCYDTERLTSYIEKSMIRDEEQFLLYNKVFTTRAVPSP
jgi:ribosomal protein S18 acetylase RimI-like enzyme